ncbi:hypothetical protein Tco_1163295 [Tanacetum coccineum]
MALWGGSQVSSQRTEKRRRLEGGEMRGGRETKQQNDGRRRARGDVNGEPQRNRKMRRAERRSTEDQRERGMKRVGVSEDSPEKSYESERQGQTARAERGQVTADSATERSQTVARGARGETRREPERPREKQRAHATPKRWRSDDKGRSQGTEENRARGPVRSAAASCRRFTTAVQVSPQISSHKPRRHVPGLPAAADPPRPAVS